MSRQRGYAKKKNLNLNKTNMQSIEALITEATKEKHRAKTGFWVTDLAGCLRGAYLARQGDIPTTPLDARTLRVFEVGNMFEDWLIGKLKKAGHELLTQERFAWPEYDLSGRSDIILLPDENKFELYEVKTQHSGSFHYRNDALDHHKEQVHLYYHAMKQMPEYKDKQGEMAVVYLSKDDLCIDQVPLDYSQSIVDNALAKAKHLKECWDTQTLPDLPEQLIMNNKGTWSVNWVAKYCNYHEHCTGDKDWLKKAETLAKARNQRK